MRMVTIAALFLALAAPAAAQAPQDAHTVVRNAVESFIRPGYKALAASTGALRSSVEALCAAPSADALDWSRERFREAVGALSEIELVRFGPVTEDNRIERLLFWPDRKGVALRQVQALLADKDEAATTADGLAAKSVAVQGFGALEFALFGSGADDLAKPGDPFRCAYGSAVAGNLDRIAARLVAAWEDPNGIARTLLEPSDAGRYRSDAEALSEIADIFVHGLEQIRDVRMNGFLGPTKAEDRPKLAIYWRSGLTIASLKSNLTGLRALYFTSGLGGLLKPDEAWISDQIAFEFDNARAALAAAEAPVAAALDDAQKRGKLDFARLVTSSLSEDFGTRLAGALGITSGFSSLDGD